MVTIKLQLASNIQINYYQEGNASVERSKLSILCGVNRICGVGTQGCRESWRKKFIREVYTKKLYIRRNYIFPE